MVMSLMRRHAKSYLIKFLIAIIALVFIFYFGYSFTSREGVKIATVNGEVISGLEYQKSYQDLLEAFRRQYKSVWNDNLIKALDLKNKALQRLIDQKLISREAKRLGLSVTDQEIQKAIMQYPAFQANGRFDVDRYRALLAQNHMKPEEFETGIADDLLQGKLKEFLLTFSPVTDQETLDYYAYNNEKVKIGIVPFSPDSYKKSAKPDEKTLESYFKAHQEDYRVPEKIKAGYLELDPAAFRDQVKVSDGDVKFYYEDHLDAYKEPKQVRARHILFKVPENAKPDEEKQIRDRAEAVLKQAREGKDFAALAKKYSEGPTKSKGGDLGYFSAGEMAKPFEEAAFKLKKGEISDLVRTKFGYHIIKVEDIKEARTKPLEEVKDQIRDILVKRAATSLAHEKGLSFLDQMPYEVDLAQYGKERNLPIHYTGYFSQDEPIPEIGGTPELRRGIFSLGEKETSELAEINGKFFIFQVAERKASYLPEMKEVSARLHADVVSDLAAKEAKADAEKYLQELRKGKDWREAAKARNLKIEETDFFSRHDSVPRVGYSPEITEAAFALNKEKRYPDKVYVNDKTAYVIRWEGKQGIDKEAFQKEKGRYRFGLMQAKQERIFQAWLENLRKKADIKIITPPDRA